MINRRSFCQRILKMILFSTLSCGLLACQKEQVEGSAPLVKNQAQIVGGQLVDPEDSENETITRSTVLVYNSVTLTRCTGVLIARTSLLTSAHCFIDQEMGRNDVINAKKRLAQGIGTDGWEIYFDQSHRADSPMAHAKKITMHPRFEKHFDEPIDTGDIAIVEFDKPSPEDFGSAQMIVRGLREQVKMNDPLIAAGYGRTKKDTQAASGVLYKTTLHILRPHYAKTEVSTLDLDHGVGNGDSGGPVFWQGKYLLGIISRFSQSEVVYTDIDIYRDWINANAK